MQKIKFRFIIRQNNLIKKIVCFVGMKIMERLFGENLKRLMIERCISGRELARLAQVRPCAISRWLGADVSRVRLATLGRISRALRIPYCALSFPPNVAGVDK